MQERGIHREREQKRERDDVLEMVISSYEIGAISTEGYYPIFLNTSRGTVHCRYYASAGKERAVIFVGGEDGGWDTPVRSRLYPQLCNVLSRQGVQCLRIQYRYPLTMTESILDVLAGITFLIQEGVTSIGLVGYSMGGAVAIQTAAASPFISTVVAISPKLFGFNAVASFRKEQSILMLHGSRDTSVTTGALSLLYRYARNPKKIIHYSKARKNLDEVAPEASQMVKDWLKHYVK